MRRPFRNTKANDPVPVAVLLPGHTIPVTTSEKAAQTLGDKTYGRWSEAIWFFDTENEV